MKNSVSVQPIKQPLSPPPKNNTCSNIHLNFLWRVMDKEGMSPRVKPGPTEHKGETISSESRSRGFQMN